MKDYTKETAYEELQELLSLGQQERSERLSEIFCCPGRTACILQEALCMLDTYAESEDEKKLIHLPCAEGDTVYKICRGACDTVQYIEHEGHRFSRTIPDLFILNKARKPRPNISVAG